MCGFEGKEESEPTPNQLLSNIPKDVSEATKLEPLDKVETWDEFTFLEDDSPPPNLLYQQFVQKTDTLFAIDVMLVNIVIHISHKYYFKAFYK